MKYYPKQIHLESTEPGIILHPIKVSFHERKIKIFYTYTSQLIL